MQRTGITGQLQYRKKLYNLFGGTTMAQFMYAPDPRVNFEQLREEQDKPKRKAKPEDFTATREAVSRASGTAPTSTGTAMAAELDVLPEQPALSSAFPITIGDVEQPTTTKTPAPKQEEVVIEEEELVTKERPDWYRPAQGFLRGLSAYGHALLQGKDEGQAISDGLTMLTAPLEEEVAAQTKQQQLDTEAFELTKGGKYTPGSIENYRKTGNSKYLIPMSTMESFYESQVTQGKVKEANKAEVQDIDKQVNIIDSITTNPKLADVLGTVEGRIDFRVDDDEADLIASINQIDAMRQMIAAKDMQGQGQISDGERAILRATTGIDRTMSPTAFKRKLGEIREAMVLRKRELMGIAPSQTGTVDQSGVKALNGQTSYRNLW